MEVPLAKGLLSPQYDSLLALQLFSLISWEDHRKTSARGNRSRWRRAIIWAWWDSASGFQMINRLTENVVRVKVKGREVFNWKWCLQLYMWHHLMRKDGVWSVDTSLAAWNTDEKLQATLWCVEVTVSCPPSSLWGGQPLQLPFLQMCQTQTCAMSSVVLISSVLVFVSSWMKGSCKCLNVCRYFWLILRE